MTEPRTQTPAAVVIGVDAHKRTHTLVAVNHLGHLLGQATVEATDSGHAKALRWAQTTFGPEPALWAIEDVRMVSRRLERFLMDAGLTVVRVPTQVMATTRASSRTHGKSDPIDATAVAVAALRYPDLPRAFHDQLSYELKLLMDHRETLIKQRSAAINRLRWRVHQLDPQYDCGPNLKADVHRALAHRICLQRLRQSSHWAADCRVFRSPDDARLRNPFVCDDSRGRLADPGTTARGGDALA